MLILTRRPMQTLTIGADITIQVMEIRGSQVRLGVQAPHDVTVLRGELCDKARFSSSTPDAGS